jgi:CubicO group peptidase (beta-lactamase class C family)
VPCSRPAATLLAGLLLLGSPARLPAQAPAAKIDALVRTYVDQGRFNGSILVADHGKVIYRKGFGWANAEWRMPNAPDTKFRIGSITKQFTAMIVLQLVEEGKLRLDGTIGEYLPEYPAGPGRAITIHQLLTHTSGLRNYLAVPNFFPELSKLPQRPAEFLAVFDSLPLDFEPGSQWRYSNSGYFVLGVIIERVGGKPYDVALRERILDPLGLRDTGYDWNEPVLGRRAEGYNRGFDADQHAAYIDMSTPFAAGAMYSTVEDLYRWDQALVARKGLSPDSYDQYLAPHASAGPGRGYGYGLSFWRIERGAGRDSAQVIAHYGGINGFSSCNLMIPADGIAIIWLDNTTQSPPLEQDIIRLLYGLPATPPPVPIGRAIYPILQREGAESAVKRYHDLRRQSPGRYDFAEPELNQLGYHLLKLGRASDAVQILKLNAEAYPESSNAYDSLGEAWLAAGDTAQAVANYRRSLERDAGNQNAVQLLRRLRAR